MKMVQEELNYKTMTRCSNCGELLASDHEAKCPKCGVAQGRNRADPAPYQRGYQQSQVVLYPKEVTTSHTPKPKLAMGLSVLSAFGGAESFAYAAGINLNPSISTMSALTTWIPSALSSYMPYLVGFAGLLLLASAFGYVKRTRWAWKIGLVSSVFGVASLSAPNLLGFIVGAVSLGLLLTNPIKHWLHHN
jgi:ribosomal protein L32